VPSDSGRGMLSLHSGPTPRGLADSAERTEVATVLRSTSASRRLIAKWRLNEAGGWYSSRRLEWSSFD
jgi:hypothetical protein